MRFKVDENLPVEAAVNFTHAGHDALTIHDQLLAGKSDTQVASVCLAEKRALVTLDLDFADIRTYPPGDYTGIIVLRPRTQGRESVLKLMSRLIPLLATEPLVGNLWILDEFNLRVREGERSPDADS